MFNLDDCLACMTSRSAKIFAEALDRRLKPYNVTRSQWIAVYYIYTSDLITQKVLADKMSVKEPSVARLIQKMEMENIIATFGTEDDKRIKQLILTDKGISLFHELLPVAEKFKNDTIAGINEEDLQTLKNTLNTMVSNALKNTTSAPRTGKTGLF